MITSSNIFYVVLDDFEADYLYMELRDALDVGAILSKEFIREHPRLTELLQALRKHKEGE